MRPILLCTAMLLLAVGCRSTVPVADAGAMADATPLVEHRAVEIPGDPLTVDRVAGRVVLKEQVVRRGDRPRLSAVVENAQANDRVILDLAARFLDGDGTALRQTEWRRVTLAPGQSHQFLAESLEPAAEVRLLLREITEATP